MIRNIPCQVEGTDFELTSSDGLVWNCKLRLHIYPLAVKTPNQPASMHLSFSIPASEINLTKMMEFHVDRELRHVCNKMREEQRLPRDFGVIFNNFNYPPELRSCIGAGHIFKTSRGQIAQFRHECSICNFYFESPALTQ